MEFIADLHIHSRFSRATSKECCPEKLDFWARRKGIHVLGTGDFTHRAWRKELAEKLDPTGDGFYTLKPALREAVDVPGAAGVKFVVSGEISSIYKKNGRTRKVHNVILLPGLDAAEKLSTRLETVGNLHSDGRPILGLDSKVLLDMTLSVCPEAIFIPAHIWTPHFSVLGANSGFDSVEECFEDLTQYIYALETGLSSDPSMNGRLSALDRFALVSNSDAHSPSNLAREANVFDTDCTYAALLDALKNNDRTAFRETIEFFPEEGKYHFDGHRDCKIQWEPARTIAANGICPVCGGRLTVGVLHRVEELADRAENAVPKNARPFVRYTTLPHIISASLGCGPSAGKAVACYDAMLRTLGPELSILRHVPLDAITSAGGTLVAEGVRRVREGRLHISPGYDGEYGAIEIFSDAERKELLGQAALFGPSSIAEKPARRETTVKKNAAPRTDVKASRIPTLNLETLNEPQLRAIKSNNGAIMVIAGPGTGKTRTLVSRIAYLVAEQHVDPASITAVTFTNKAASEMRVRLAALLPAGAADALSIGTFHGICLSRLRAGMPLEASPVIVDPRTAAAIVRNLIVEQSLTIKPSRFLRDLSMAKGCARPLDRSLDAASFALYEAYRKRLDSIGALDFDDLLLRALDPARRADVASALTDRSGYLLVDEFQDINEIQFELVKTWAAATGNVFVIGDPHQSIYGFRGASPRFFEEFRSAFPAMLEITLTQNYRSPAAIVESAKSVIARSPDSALHPAQFVASFETDRQIRLVTARNESAEATFLAQEINRMVGGVDMVDAHRFGGRKKVAGTYGFGDIAILYRTHRQAQAIERCLVREGIAYRVAGRDETLSEPSASNIISMVKFVLNPADLFSLMAVLEYCGEPADYAAQYAAGLRSLDNLVFILETAGADVLVPGKFLRAVNMFRNAAVNRSPRETVSGLAEIFGTSGDEPVDHLLHIADLHDDLSSFVQTITLGDDADIVRSGNRTRPRADAVLLSTLHAAKGLEFPVVFICGLSDGLLPLRDAEGECADVNEERRLFYVGITRAREELVLTLAAQRAVYGESIRCGLSPFAGDIDEKYILHETWRPEPAVEQMRLF